MNYPERLRKLCPGTENPPLRDRTYVRIGGAAPLLLEPRDRSELARALHLLHEEHIPFRILGGGSNLLVADAGVSSVVISLRKVARFFRVSEEECLYRAEGGYSLPRLVSTCRNQGLKGLECLVGIPGTVGGGAVMNAGGRHGTIGSLIEKATVVTASGTLEERLLDRADFGYRTSTLRGEVIVDVELRLEKGDRDRIWEKTTSILEEKKNAQPLMKKSCGCVFKNPAGRSAGELLDSAGMKGRRTGDARVSEKHANFILNEGNATFQDYHALIREGRRRVRETHGIELDLEVEIWRDE
jgi:UDP-N-acetylmuramate dehydrogenase